MGILPYLDFSVQYSYAYKKDKSYDGYLSDRSLNFKYQLPYFQRYASFAIGGQDLIGGAQHLKSIYAVASKKFKYTYLSAGYAHGFNEGSLDGLFGNFVVKPLDWLEIGVEYDTKEYNWVVKTELKSSFYDTPLRLGLIYKNSFNFNRSVFAGYMALDFNRKVKFKVEVNEYKHFANYTLKNVNNTVYYTFENNLYSNDKYALKQALASLSNIYKDTQKIVVTLKKANLPLLTLSTNPKKYLYYLKNGGKSPINIDKSMQSESIKNSDLLKPYIKLTPSINLVDGSEYGNLDYAFALNLALSTRLANGLLGAVNLYVPVKTTYNFKKRHVFAYRNRDKDKVLIDTALLNKYFIYKGKNFNWLNSFQVGLFDYKLSGLAWQSALLSRDNKHMLELKLGYFKDNLYKIMYKYNNNIRKEALVRYSYFWKKFNSQLSVTAGEFLYGDKGVDIGVKRYFGSIYVKADLAYTKHSLRGTNKIAKLQIVIPLGKKSKDFKYANFALGDFKYERKKTIVANGSRCLAQPMHLKETDNSYNLENYLLDYGRDNLPYNK